MFSPSHVSYLLRRVTNFCTNAFVCKTSRKKSISKLQTFGCLQVVVKRGEYGRFLFVFGGSEVVDSFFSVRHKHGQNKNHNVRWGKMGAKMTRKKASNVKELVNHGWLFSHTVTAAHTLNLFSTSDRVSIASLANTQNRTFAQALKDKKK